MNTKEPTKIIICNQSRLADWEAVKLVAHFLGNMGTFDAVFSDVDLPKSVGFTADELKPKEIFASGCRIERATRRSSKFNTKTFTITNA